MDDEIPIDRVMRLVKRSRTDIARRAALAFYGLSSSTKDFPKGVDVEVKRGGSKGVLKGTIAKIAEEVEKAWNENVGSMSRTARLSSEDIKYLAKRLGLKVTDKNVEEWMKAINGSHPAVYLVMIKNNRKSKKFLLVNTDVTK